LPLENDVTHVVQELPVAEKGRAARVSLGGVFGCPGRFGERVEGEKEGEDKVGSFEESFP
jgi:hypothetical protein